MELQSVKQEGVVVIKVKGRLDTLTAPDFERDAWIGWWTWPSWNISVAPGSAAFC